MNLASKLFPNVAKGATKLFQAGKGLVTKGLAKVGGFAAKIFGKAAGVIAPAFKGAKPFLSKFFGKIPIVEFHLSSLSYLFYLENQHLKRSSKDWVLH